MTVMMIGGGENVMRWKDGLVLPLLKSFVSIIQSSIFKKVNLYLLLALSAFVID